jgi:fatty-acyl-CoA synthase
MRAICPAYGLAEAGVAVTLVPPDEPYATRTFDLETVQQTNRSTAGFSIACVGRPLPGYSLATKTSSMPSSISIRGPSIGLDEHGNRLVDDAGWFRTGDLGWLDDDQKVWILGRIDDTIVVRGQNLWAPALEEYIGTLNGIRPGRVIAVTPPTGGLLIAAEPKSDSQSAQSQDVVRAVADWCGARPDAVLILTPGSLPFTPSGKPIRRALVAQLASGGLADYVLEGDGIEQWIAEQL